MKNLLIFVGGVAVGSIATFFVVKDRFQKICDQEIGETRAMYQDKIKKLEKEKANIVNEEPEAEVIKDIDIPGPAEKKLAVRNPDLKEIAASMIHEEGYSPEPVAAIRKKLDEPYVISPDEFGDLDYECISLTYYEDNILADDDDEIIDDILDTVGSDALDAFGREDGEEEFTVHVRNDARKCDYEICRDFRKYDDVMRAENPHF